MLLSFVSLALLFLVGVKAQSCTARYECAVGSDYEYVDCIDGECQCLTSQGFIGTPSTGCYCDPSNTIQWQGSTPYCLNLPFATQLQVDELRGQSCIAQAQRVYNYLVYPTPILILNGSLSTADLFTPNVTGRVDPYGVFAPPSLEDYFYAFAVLPGSGIVKVIFQDLAWNGTTSTVTIRVIIEFGVFIGHLLIPAINFTESGHFRFTQDNLISSADLVVHNSGWGADRSIANLPSFYNQTCTLYFAACNSTTDPEGYYGTMTNCLNFMNAQPYQLPNGTIVSNAPVRHLTVDGTANVTYDQPAGNTPICRWQHVTIAKYVPVPHCTHAGITGGGVCTDPPYYATYYSPSQVF